MHTPEWWKKNRSTYELVRDTLAYDYPTVFNSATPLPLKINIEIDLMAEYIGWFTPRDIHVFMTFWTSRKEYVVAVACHRVRYGIERETYPLLEAHKQNALKVIEKLAFKYSGGINAKGKDLPSR
jgi:hypothetical protein